MDTQRNGIGARPGKAYLGGADRSRPEMADGAYRESGRPVYVMYEGSRRNAEHTVLDTRTRSKSRRWTGR